jgi:hypothetical protein
MSLLERRYRAVLRLLPASYRAEREEEMVAEFMEMSGDVPDEVSPRPRWGEITSVLALSLRVRLSGTRAAPRFFAWGEAVRLVALLGLAWQTVWAVFVAADLIRGLTFEYASSVVGAPGSLERLLHIGEPALAAGSGVAFAAIMRGRVRLAKVAAVVGALPALVFAVTRGATPWLGIPSLSAAGGVLITAVPLIALLAGFHSDVSPLRRPWRLVLAPVAAGLALAGALELVFRLGLGESPWLSFWLELTAMASVALAAASALPLVRRSPSWLLALSASGVLLLLTRLPLLAYPRTDEPSTIAWAMICAQCVLLAVLIVTLARAGLRSLPESRSFTARP